MPAGAADVQPSPSLKRGTSEDDSDAVLAEAFGDDDGCEMDVPHASESMSCDDDDEAHPPSDRPMRPLPARQGLRATQSMPPSAPAWRDLAAESHRDADAFRLIDFSAFAAHADHF